MKLFMMSTITEQGNYRTYLIRHPQIPSKKEIKGFLIRHGDTEGTEIYEQLLELRPLMEDSALTIPAVSEEELNRYDYL